MSQTRRKTIFLIAVICTVFTIFFVSIRKQNLYSKQLSTSERTLEKTLPTKINSFNLSSRFSDFFSKPRKKLKYNKTMVVHTKASTKSSSFSFIPTDEGDEIWETTQNQRKKHLKEKCKILSNTSEIPSLSKFHLNNILVDDRHNLLYCYIPKIACTQWKRIMMVLTGTSNVKDPEEISHLKAHYFSGLKLLVHSNFNKSEIFERLGTYKKFLIVRHPMERLFSAFTNKFVENSTDANMFKRIYAYKMMRFTRNSSNIPLSGEGMKFHEFLSFIVSHVANGFQEHWSPYLHLCHPCSIDYDFIGKYETLSDDSNQILKRLRPPSKLKFPSFNPSNTSRHLKEVLKEIPLELYKKVFTAYESDFTLFSYKQDSL